MFCKLLLRNKSTVLKLSAGIIDWNPCTRPPGQSSTPSSYIVAVGSYVYVHCSTPDDGSYMMQCPGSTVWNPQANGCTDFGGGGGQSPPRLVGPLNSAGRPPQGGVGQVTSTPTTTVRPHQHPLHQFFAGLPYSLLLPVSRPPSRFYQPSGSAGDLASQMTENPCVVDDRGTLSPIRFHPYPNDPSKYLECVPKERSVISHCYDVYR